MAEAVDHRHPDAGRQDALASALPTRLGAFNFAARAAALRAGRVARDLHDGIRRWPQEDDGAFELTSESRSPLWTEAEATELVLQRGKVQNLRQAVRRLHGTVVPAKGVFSFWKQVGRATRRRGYVDGRELREGCLVPAVGGGLCQLSNALYDAALRAGIEILERHPHSRAVPGSAAAAGRDATVAWNYLDLRFCGPWPFRIHASLTGDELIVRLLRPPHAAVHPFSNTHPFRRGDGPLAETGLPMLAEKDGSAFGKPILTAVRSCTSCGETACFRHRPAATDARPAGRTAFLLDERWPEFETYVSESRREGDVLAIPLDGARWRLPRYAWETKGFDRVTTATAPTLLRSLATRRLGRYGAARLQAQIDGARELAAQLTRSLTPEVTRVCCAQSLLPFLWREGHLGGRRVTVLATRLPLRTLHARLDAAAARHPDRPTLLEFRAPDWLVAAEQEALDAADAIVTPHSEVAARFAGRAALLNWHLPAPPLWTPGPLIAFPGPTAARKGAYELREVARELGLQLLLPGSELEGPDFWDGIETRRPDPAERGEWLRNVRAVVQPAVVEDQPGDCYPPSLRAFH